ncbi:hypothetical protein EDC56_2230 [Sinobacterium caligoides]|uniref:DUF6603 domain-containing protein n=1 Tax=Sinobacterium caligoides TaxID=933926 RepID=A0A3N2DR63_9GAMM|nr:DUF6603 domain-containing protein [Sinobacterium caligoides]ROS01785.1 hypothetical protein EDC56_2230 [Sinobacterium caligoides]
MTTENKAAISQGLGLSFLLPYGGNSGNDKQGVAPELSVIRRGDEFIVTGKLGKQHLFPELVDTLELNLGREAVMPKVSDFLTDLRNNIISSLDGDSSAGLSGVHGYLERFKSCFANLVDVNFSDIEFSIGFGKEINPLSGSKQKVTSLSFSLETEYLAIQLFYKKSAYKSGYENTDHNLAKGIDKRRKPVYKTSSKMVVFAKPKDAVALREIIPLVDTELVPNFSLDACFICASTRMSANDIARLMALKPNGVDSQPLLSGLADHTLIDKIKGGCINKGVSILANVALNTEEYPLYISLQGEEDERKAGSSRKAEEDGKQGDGEQLANDNEPVTKPNEDENDDHPSSKGAQDKTVVRKAGSDISGKQLGPISVDRLTVGFSEQEIQLHMDAALSMASFQLVLQAFVMRVNVDEVLKGDLAKALDFSLDGVDITLAAGGLSLGGGLMRFPSEDDGADEYVGHLALETKLFSLNVLGAYSTMKNGQTSLFAYLAIECPLGGVPAFFVEGLALGFGYNRGIELPPIGELHQFPLIEVFREDDENEDDVDPLVTLRTQASNLSRYLPASAGQYLVAAGIKFNTYKLIDSIGVLMVEFGQHFSIHLLGNSVVAFPFAGKKVLPVPPIVNIDMNYRVSYEAEKGTLQLEAQLNDNSYLFSRECKLTGGFAFYSWFKGDHKGDFVVTMGGYHPKFNKPEHYPDVPRLGFLLQLGDTVSIKGGMYAALTPVAIMAGAGLSAVYESGALKAHFNAGVDFIICWQPFYYEAEIAVNIGASLDIDLGWLGSTSISGEFGADLRIWGPEFAGEAAVKLLCFEVNIDFGAASSLSKEAISWQEFIDNYINIPDENSDAEFVEINVLKGSQGTAIEKLGVREIEWNLVDLDNFELLVDSPVPLSLITIDGESKLEAEQAGFHLAPMGAHSVDDWAMDISCDRGGQFIVKPIEKAFPKAVYGNSSEPSIEQDETMLMLPSGGRIVSKPGKKPGFSDAIDVDEFSYENIKEDDAHWQWGDELDREWLASTSDPDALGSIQITLSDVAVQQHRASVADFFNYDAGIITTEGMCREIRSVFIGNPSVIDVAR